MDMMSKAERTRKLKHLQKTLSTREMRESFMRKRGWVRLVDRADVWVNLNRKGRSLHDVFLFEIAYKLALCYEYDVFPFGLGVR